MVSICVSVVRMKSPAKHHVRTYVCMYVQYVQYMWIILSSRKLDTARGKLQDVQKMLSQAGLVTVTHHACCMYCVYECTLCVY